MCREAVEASVSRARDEERAVALLDITVAKENAARAAREAAIVTAASWTINGDYICGPAYEGFESLDVLDDVVDRLRAVGGAAVLLMS